MKVSQTKKTGMCRFDSPFEISILGCFDLVMSRLLCSGVNGGSSVMFAGIGLRRGKTSLEITLSIDGIVVRWNDRNVFLRFNNIFFFN